MTSQGKIFWLGYTINDIQVHNFLLLGLILGVLYTVANSIKRLQQIPKSFIHYIVNGSILIFLCVFYQINWYFSFFIINVYSADLILKSMNSHLLDAEDPKPDLIVYVLYLFLFFQLFFEYELYFCFQVYGIIVMAKILWNLFHIFYKLRNYWVWWNLN